MDWSRRACSRRGHVLYEPTEQQFIEQVRANTGFGHGVALPALRGLRADEPTASGPADRTPLVPLRRKALRSLFVLRFLAVERVLRGLLMVLAAWAVWKFSNSAGRGRNAVRATTSPSSSRSPTTSTTTWTTRRSSTRSGSSSTTRTSTCEIAAGALAVYALIEIVRGRSACGWAKRWAEYLTVVATAAVPADRGVRTHREDERRSRSAPSRSMCWRSSTSCRPSGCSACAAGQRPSRPS